MDTFFQEILGGVGRRQENIGVTLFLKDTVKNKGETIKLSAAANTCDWCGSYSRMCVSIGFSLCVRKKPGVSLRLIILTRG